jgi:hypothetical protein
MISLYFSKRYLTSGGEAAAEGIKFNDQSLFSKRYLTSGGEAAAEGSSFMISLYFQTVPHIRRRSRSGGVKFHDVNVPCRNFVQASIITQP